LPFDPDIPRLGSVLALGIDRRFLRLGDRAASQTIRTVVVVAGLGSVSSGLRAGGGGPHQGEQQAH
jgi:hypothetical protein